jgi:diguanylate cyclase (GGDEF)-like protein
MSSAAVPSNAPAPDAARGPDAEAHRLAALHAHGILDTPPEPAFDTVARVAAQLFGMPMAFIGMLDADRASLKARVGLPSADLQRDVALGAWKVAQSLEGALPTVVIPDLRLDARFAGIPMVSSGRTVRFFASAPIVDENGHVLGLIGVLDTAVRAFNQGQRALLQDMATLALTALQARQRGRALQQMSQADPLTGAADAQQFEQALEVELRHAMRTGEPFAVLRLDLDGFSDINTAYGQAAGDAVLREVGRRLQQQVRIGDLLARLGSDDFGIVMRHGGETEAQRLAGRIVAAVRQPVRLGAGGDEVSPGISVGVAAYTDRIAAVGELLAESERSLAQARALKESRWMVFGKLFEQAPELRLVGGGSD